MRDWMLAANLFGLVVGISALLVQAMLRGTRVPTRWLWVTALTLTALWPLVGPVWQRVGGQDGVSLPAETESAIALAVGSVSSGGASDADWYLLGAWGLLSTLLLLRLAWAGWQLRGLRRNARVTVVDGVPVHLTATAGPAVCGVVRPIVLFPAWALSLSPELRAMVLAHEQEHARHGDQRLLCGALLASALLPWLLPLWGMSRALRRAIEVDCDTRTLARGLDRIRYGEVLLLIVARRWQHPAATGLGGSAQALRQRMARVLHPPVALRRGARAVLAAVVLVLMAGACAMPAPRPTLPTRASALVTESSDAVSWSIATTLVSDRDTYTLESAGDLTYPLDAQRKGLSGDVQVRVSIGADGHATGVALQSTTNTIFSDPVLASLRSSRYTPKVVAGTAVPYALDLRVAFRWLSARPADGLVPPVVDPARGRGNIGRSDRPL